MKKMMMKKKMKMLGSKEPSEPIGSWCVSLMIMALGKRGQRIQKWIHAMTDSVTTTNHDAIRSWAEQRGGHPATVQATEEDGHAGILRIDFDPKEKALEPIEWNEFFRKFDESDLAFLYQDRTKDGKLSRFHKFVHRTSAH